MPLSLNTLDLNLLRVFDALMDERSVLRAGRRLGLSQSAVSHALSRLRDVLGDELFVRTGAGMHPTARAIAMAGHVREALIQVDLAIGSMTFDPATAVRQFVIAANDAVTAVHVPRFRARLAAEAPGIDLVVRPATRIDLAEQIDLGRIELAIGSFGSIPRRFRGERLYDDEDALIVDAGSPLARRRIALSDLAASGVIVVSLGGPEEGAQSGFIFERGLARRSEMFDRAGLEAAMAEAGQPLRIVLAQPHFLALPALLAGTDDVAIVPAALGRHLAGTAGIRVRPLPYPTTPVPVDAVWHERNDADGAHRWFRGLLKRAAP